MVQIIPRNRPTFGEHVAGGIGKGLNLAQEYAKMAQQTSLKNKAKQDERSQKLAGLENIKKTKFWKDASEAEKAVIESEIKGDISAQTSKSLINLQREKEGRSQINKYLENEEDEIDDEISSNSKSVKKDAESKNKSKYAGKLSDLALADIASGSGPEAKWAQGIQDLRKEERGQQFKIEQEKNKRAEREEEHLRAETFPIRQEIANKAQIARKGIEDKQNLIKIIDTGEIDDPTFVIAMEALPLNFGRRFLSPKTVEYKAGLVQGYSDLKTLFTGATRVKEVEILENKIADTYLSDEQKKAILKSSIDVQKRDILIAEAAAELEGEGKKIGVLQYNQELMKRAEPKLNALFDKIIDEQKAIIQNAENRKKIPLSLDDPTDVEIIDQILAEAGGDWKKAEKLAKKKGYTF